MSERKFAAALEKQLELFKTATEWSDLVAYLSGLEGILCLHRFSKVPHAFLLYRRLKQCLNPALPAGVHIKALGVYRLVISRVGREYLAENVEVLCLGLFSFHTHAGLSTLPKYLEILHELVGLLGPSSKKVAKQVVLGTVSGLEEESSEHFAQAIGILQGLESQVGRPNLHRCVWSVMAECADLVPGCIAYLSKAEAEQAWALGRSDAPEMEIANEYHEKGYEKGIDRVEDDEEEKEKEDDLVLLGKGFAAALSSKDIVTLRKAFDLLLSYKAKSLQLGAHELPVALAVLQLLLTKEMSLFKRVQQWMSLAVAEKNGVFRVCSVLKHLHSENRRVYFKVLLALHQGIQEAALILRGIIAWTISVTDARAPDAAKELFAAIDRRIFWGALSEKDTSVEVVDMALRFGMADDHARKNELPGIIIRRITEKGSVPQSWLDSVKGRIEDAEYEEILCAAAQRLSLHSVYDSLHLATAVILLRPHLAPRVLDAEPEKEKSNQENGISRSFAKITAYICLLWDELARECKCSTGAVLDESVISTPHSAPPEREEYTEKDSDALIDSASTGDRSQRQPHQALPKEEKKEKEKKQLEMPLASRFRKEENTSIDPKCYACNPELVEQAHLVAVQAVSALLGTDPDQVSSMNLQRLFPTVSRTPYLFWKYNTVLLGKLEHMIVQTVLQHEERIKDERAVERMFSLVERAPAPLTLSMARLVRFLLSLNRSSSFWIRERTRMFAARIAPGKELLRLGLLLLAQPTERALVGDQLVVHSCCDYNRVLAGVHLLYMLVKYSRAFVPFLLQADALEYADETAELEDVTQYVLEKASPGVLETVVSVLLFYMCAEHEDSLGGCIIEKHREEIEKRGLCIVVALMRAAETGTFTDSSGLLGSLGSLLLKKPLSEGRRVISVRARMEVLDTVGIQRFGPDITDAYVASEEMREGILECALDRKDPEMLVKLLGISSGLISKRPAFLETARVFHILQHCITNEPQRFVCCCGSDNVQLDRDQLLTAVISILTAYVDLEDSARTPQRHPEYQEDERKKRISVILVRIRKYCSRIYRTHQVEFAEALLAHYALYGSPACLGAVEEKMEEEIFSSVLWFDTQYQEKKYLLLEEWLESCKDRVFEREKSLGIMGMLLSRARTRPEDPRMFAFFARAYRLSRTRQALDVGAKALEAAVISGVRMGAKKIMDTDAPEKLDVLKKMIEVVNNFVQTAASIGSGIDLLGVWNTYVLPCLRLPEDSEAYAASLRLALAVASSRQKEKPASWHRSYYDYIQSDRFFRDTPDRIQMKMEIARPLVDSEKVSDLISKAAATGFFLRDINVPGKVATIKRLRFMVLSGEFGELQKDLSNILGLVSEIFSASAGVRPLVSEAYALCRALCIRMPPGALVNMWPLTTSEAMSTLVVPENRACASISFSALQFLDLVATLNSVETLELRWMVEGISNTEGMSGNTEGISDTEGSSAKKEPKSTSKNKPEGKTQYNRSADRVLCSQNLRRPCIIRASDWVDVSLSAAIEAVSRHHRKQNRASEVDACALEASLASDLSEL